jgi:hypothetical protein
MKPLILLLLCFPVLYAQEGNLPEYGDIADLKNLQKVYLSADSTGARKLILNELKKYPNLNIVNSPDDAEFFLEYKVLRHEDATGVFIHPPVTTSEMTAYVVKDKRRRVAWSKTQDDAGISRANEINLTRNFIKAIKKVSAQKKESGP